MQACFFLPLAPMLLLLLAEFKVERDYIHGCVTLDPWV